MQRSAFIAMARRRARRGSGSTRGFRARRTWKAGVSDLRAIIRSTPFAVVGGVATRLYMPERATLDLDILVRAAAADALHAELRTAGCQYHGRLSAGESHWQLPDETKLDVIESDAAWVLDALATAKRAPDGLPVADLAYLVLMKMDSGRTQDLADVSRMLGAAAPAELERVHGVLREHLADALEDMESLAELGRLENEE